MQSVASRPRWQRGLWFAAGGASFVLAIVGVALPVLPTVPFLLLAAWCFSRGCLRCERWMLEHPRFGPPLQAWRAHRVVPLRAKQFATAMMAGSAVLMWWLIGAPWALLPVGFCVAVAAWLWTLPSKAPAGAEETARQGGR
jgi:uncharacterized membrane protein YbaN (DUF454 family)